MRPMYDLIIAALVLEHLALLVVMVKREKCQHDKDTTQVAEIACLQDEVEKLEEQLAQAEIECDGLAIALEEITVEKEKQQERLHTLGAISLEEMGTALLEEEPAIAREEARNGCW